MPVEDTNLDRLKQLVAYAEEAAKGAHSITAALETSTPAEIAGSVAEIRILAEALATRLQSVEALSQQLVALESELQEANTRIDAILGTTISAVIAINVEAKVVLWNPSAERIFGWTAEEAIGRRLEELIVPERYRGYHRAGIERFVASGKSDLLYRRIRSSAIRKDGDEIAIEMTIGLGWHRERVVFYAFLLELDRTPAHVTIDELIGGVGGVG